MENRNSRMPGPSCIAMAIGGALAAGMSLDATATDYDVNRMIVERLQKAGALPAIYQKQYGRPLPGGVQASAMFAGEVGGRGISFGNFQAFPRPTVLKSERVHNCNDQMVTKTFGVESETADSGTLKNSDTVSNSHKASVNIKVKSPLVITGAEVSAGYTFEHALSTTTEKEDTKSRTLKWHDSQQIPVAPGKSLIMQYVVTERVAENIPFTANLILSGPTEIEFGGGSGAGYRWVQKQGNSIPSDAIRAGAENNQTPFLCRVPAGDGFYFGKGFVDTCYYNETAGTDGKRRAKSRTTNYEVLTGNQESFRWGDPYKFPDQQFDADGRGYRKICWAMWSANRAIDSIPGFAQGGNCLIVNPAGYEQKQEANSSYSVLLNPVPNRVRINLDDYLNERDRTFDLRGYYKTNMAVDGDFRTSSPVDADCSLLKSGAAPGVMPTGASGAGDRPGVITVASKDPPLPPNAVTKKSPRPR